jgi:hypothetical protein
MGVGIATGIIPGSARLFPSLQLSDWLWGFTQPPVQWARGVLFPGVKRQGREADHLPPSSAEVKNGGAVPPLPHMPSWYNVKLNKRRMTLHFFM